MFGLLIRVYLKQLRLLTMAVCALLMSSTALAQEDITSQYLTNADLSTKDGGWQNGGYTAWAFGTKKKPNT